MKVDRVLHSGEVFEQVFMNEQGLDLRIIQEAGSRVRIFVINIPDTPESPDVPELPEILNRIVVEQAGEKCETEIYALAHLRGEQKVTTETHVTHSVGGGVSNQLIKFVLDDRSRGHFIGDLKIVPDAQQTEAHQTNRNLVLSEASEMRTQPQLEIYADDVKATHGASTGQLDEAALFYMQQRGISRPKARQLLVDAFMREIIEAISPQHSAIRGKITQYIESES